MSHQIFVIVTTFLLTLSVVTGYHIQRQLDPVLLLIINIV